LPTE
ncbi:membrane-fusion domain protein, partial [Vibrio parahaemolyticus EKP-028]